MEPQTFLNKWKITQTVLAACLGVGERTVQTWTASPTAKKRVKPPETVLNTLRILDQLWQAQGKKPGKINIFDLMRETDLVA